MAGLRDEDIFSLIRRSPRGRVTSYGRVAELLGSPRGARRVGQALFRLSEGTDVPWHRVVNAQGRISELPHFGGRELQRLKLEEEGVRFDRCGVIDLDRYGWQPRSRRPPRK